MQRVKAEPDEILMVDLPEWRIVEDEVWFAVQERFVRHADAPGDRKPAQRSGKYALTGIARCGECGGAIGCARTKRRGEVVKSYVCMRHKERGAEACSVAVNQPMHEVEGALIDFIQKDLLSGAVLENVLVEVRREVEAQMPKRDADIAALEAELVESRAEQRKLARAVALDDDIPEFVSELRQRSARIQHLEVQVAASRQTPEEIAALIANVEATCRARLKDLRAALSDPGDLRDVFLAFFPEGLTFTAESVTEEVPSRRRWWHRKSDRNVLRPVLRKNRRVWRAKGAARLGGFDCVATPTGFERGKSSTSDHEDPATAGPLTGATNPREPSRPADVAASLHLGEALARAVLDGDEVGARRLALQVLTYASEPARRSG